MMAVYLGGPRERDKESRSGLGGSEKVQRESDIKSETRGEFTLKSIKLKPQAPSEG